LDTPSKILDKQLDELMLDIRKPKKE
jgi:hypothetical protein